MLANRKVGIDNESVREAERRFQEAGGIPSLESRVAPEQLASIYRSAKTREEIKQDDDARERLFAARVPKWPMVKISLLTSVLFFALLIFIVSIEPLWFFGQLAGISLTFLLTVVIFFSYYLIYAYVERVFFMMGRSLRMFIFGYVGVFIISLLGGSVMGLLMEQKSPLIWVLTTTAFHVGVVFILSFFALKKRS